MATKFANLREKMSPESRARAEAKAHAMLAEMPLNELRQARGLSQKMSAKMLHVQQPSIAKIEKRTDMYISTLRSHIDLHSAGRGSNIGVISEVEVFNLCVVFARR